MKINLSIFLLIIATYSINAQSKIELGLVGIPSITNMYSTYDFDLGYESLFTMNYGIKANLVKEKFIFSTGILHFTQGVQFEVEKSTVNIPEGTGEFFDVFVRAKAVIIPLSVDYLIGLSEKTGFIVGLGFYPGYIYSQQMENTSIPENYQPDPFITPAQPVERFTDFDHFNDFYFGINAGLGVRHSFNEKISFLLRPNILYQIRKDLPKEKYAGTYRLMSYSVDVGLFYKFGGNND